MPVPTSGSQGELLSAYLDGELAPREQQEVERLLRESAEARALLDNLKAVREGLLALPRRFAPQDLASSISAQLERDALLGEQRPTAPGARLSRRAGWSVFAAAAVLTFASLLWWQLDHWRTPTTPPDRLVSASGERAAPESHYLGKPLSERGESATLTEEKALDEGAALARKPADRSWSRGAPVAGEGSDLNSGSVPSPLTERLLASASLAQKIEAGVGLETLRKHHFDTESSELTIECTSDEQRNEVMRTLLKALKDAGAVNLALTDEVPAGAAFAEGKLGVNYSLAEEKQFIVCLPAEQWTGVIEAVEHSAADARPEMRSGLVVGTGWKSAQTLLAGDAETTSLGYFALRLNTDKERVPTEDEAEQESPPPLLDARQVSAEAAVRDLVGVLLVPGGDSSAPQAAEPLAEKQRGADGSTGLAPGAPSEDEGRFAGVAETMRNEPDATAHDDKDSRKKDPSAKAEESATQVRVALAERGTPPQAGVDAPVDRGEGALEAKQTDKPPPSGGAAIEPAKPAARRPASSEKKAKAAKPVAPAENTSAENAPPVDAAAGAPATRSADAEVADQAAPEPSSTPLGKRVAAAEPQAPPSARERAALRGLGYVDDDATEAPAESRDSSLVERRRRALAIRGGKDELGGRPASAAAESEPSASDEVLKEMDPLSRRAPFNYDAPATDIVAGERVIAGRGVAPRARAPVMFGLAPDLRGRPTVVVRLRVVPPAVE
ncbi:MAG: zf-HC2 domain-containing protein [Phycisphaerales bacterium]|nr:zf-HC2 domain-containing protein [Phycisphaerales bacterium]